jgi:ribosomal protein S18 acetylase RimI-like enzyme
MSALQDSERTLEPAMLRPGADMAESHVAHLLETVTAHDGLALIAEDPETGAPVGMLIGHVEQDPGTFLEDHARRVGRVTDLYVVPQARRRGLARALIAAAEDHFRALGVTRMQIGVLAGNTRAQALYRAAGYRPWLQIMDRRII